MNKSLETNPTYLLCLIQLGYKKPSSSYKLQSRKITPLKKDQEHVCPWSIASVSLPESRSRSPILEADHRIIGLVCFPTVGGYVW